MWPPRLPGPPRARCLSAGPGPLGGHRGGGPAARTAGPGRTPQWTAVTEQRREEPAAATRAWPERSVFQRRHECGALMSRGSDQVPVLPPHFSPQECPSAHTFLVPCLCGGVAWGPPQQARPRVPCERGAGSPQGGAAGVGAPAQEDVSHPPVSGAVQPGDLTRGRGRGAGSPGPGCWAGQGKASVPGACGSGGTGGCGFIRRRGRSHHPRQPPSRSTLTSSTRCSKHAAGLPVCGLLCPPPSAFSTARPPTASLGGAAPRAGLDSPHLPLPLGWGCRAHKALPAPHCPSWPSAQPSSHSISVVIATPFRVVRPAV